MTGVLRAQCKVCGEPVPPGRRAYCSDTCHLSGNRARARDRQDRRNQGCVLCGATKRPVRGARYCEDCHKEAESQYDAYEHHRTVTKVRARRVARIAAGETIRRRDDAPEGRKWCAHCQEFRPLDQFAVGRSGKVGAYCRPCTKTYNLERRLRTVFGLTFEQYDALFTAQDGRCAICQRHPRRLRLAVDHDHKTGAIRGLLCGRCNHKLLGAADENPERLRRAAHYLEEPPAAAVLMAADVWPELQEVPS